MRRWHSLTTMWYSSSAIFFTVDLSMKALKRATRKIFGMYFLAAAAAVDSWWRGTSAKATFLALISSTDFSISYIDLGYSRLFFIPERSISMSTTMVKAFPVGREVLEGHRLGSHPVAPCHSSVWQEQAEEAERRVSLGFGVLRQPGASRVVPVELHHPHLLPACQLLQHLIRPLRIELDRLLGGLPVGRPGDGWAVPV